MSRPVAILVRRAGAVAPPTTGGDTTVPLISPMTAYEAWRSMGGNLHLPYTGTQGYDNDEVVQNVLDLGLAAVRDELVVDKGPDHRAYRRHRELGAAGVKSVLIAGHPRGTGPEGGADGSHPLGRFDIALNCILDPRYYGGYVDELCGANEFLGGSATDADRTVLQTHQRHIADTLEASPEPLAARLRAELWAPSQAFADRQNAYTARFNDGVSTRGDMHSYPGGVSGVSKAGTGSFFTWFDAALRAVPGAAPTATETGYHSAWKGSGHTGTGILPTFGHVPTNSDGYRIMAPRLFFDYLLQGVHRTFLYQVRDNRTETELVDREFHFGLFTAAGVMKPEGRAVARTTGRIREAPSTRRQVRLGVSGSGVWHLPVTRGDGALDVMLWQREHATLYGGPGDITLLSVPTVPATVRFGSRVRLEAYHPSELSTGVVDLGVVEAGVAKTVQVPHHVLMLRAIPV